MAASSGTPDSGWVTANPANNTQANSAKPAATRKFQNHDLTFLFMSKGNRRLHLFAPSDPTQPPPVLKQGKVKRRGTAVSRCWYLRSAL
jgi:hypothetical protein